MAREHGTHAECGKNFKKSFCLQRWHVLTQNQVANWASVILGQIPHCMEQNSSQMIGLLHKGGWAALE